MVFIVRYKLVGCIKWVGALSGAGRYRDKKDAKEEKSILDIRRGVPLVGLATAVVRRIGRFAGRCYVD